MLSINEKRSCVGVTWRGYVKGIQNLERCATNFSCWIEIQVVEPGDHVLYKWKVDKCLWLCRVLKHMGKLVVRLKAIEYKENFFYYLSSYFPDLGLQVAYILIFIFPTVYLQNFCILGRMHLFIQAFLDPGSVLQSKPLFAEFLADSQKINFFCSNWVDQTLRSRTYCIQQAVPPTTRMVVTKA